MVDPFGWCGATLDAQYRIDAVIAENRFGLIYKAFHLDLRETVTIKCLTMPASLSPADREEFKESFLEEGRLLQRLARANAGIARALDVGTAESPKGIWTPYLVIEWLEGCGLDHELSRRRDAGRGTFDLREALELLNPAALALAEAHNQGISHCDITPANLLLARIDSTTTLKILDFGIAKLLTSTSITHALQATGDSLEAFTPQYGTPEQFDSRYGDTGPWTDVFALALVFVELLTGRSALDGEDTMELMAQSANPQERPTPRRRGASVPQAVEEVLGKALEVQPQSRFLSAGAFWSALQTAVNAAPLEAPVDSPQSTASVPASAAALPAASENSPPTAPHIPPAPSTHTKKKGPFFALSLVVTILVGAGVATMVMMLRPFLFPAWLPTSDPASDPASDPPSASAKLRASAPTASFKPPALQSTSATARRTGLPMPVHIAPGTFVMGSTEGDPSEGPAHEVTITRPFVIDAVEVTVEAYMKCVGRRECTLPGAVGTGVDKTAVQPGGPKCHFLNPSKARHPINCVDRKQAETYCESVGKRLPTEAEWEYAARGSDGRVYPWGATSPTCGYGALGAVAEGSCSRSGTEQTGSYPEDKSPFGVFDLAGNVREWVADGWDEHAYSKPATPDPVVVNTAAKGIVRGGSWNSPPEDLRSSRRVPLAPETRDAWTGFRCVASP